MELEASGSLYCKSTVVKTKEDDIGTKINIDQWNKTEENPEKDQHTYGQQTMTKEARTYDGEKTVSLINGAISNPET